MNIINVISFDFAAIDRLAWTIFFVGWIIVFTALISLSIIFRHMPKLVSYIENEYKSGKAKKKQRKAPKKTTESLQKTENKEVYAAIAMAVNFYKSSSLRDEENFVLTIDRDTALKSSWSSKIHSINTI